MAAALEEYLDAHEAGSPPSREEFLARHAAIAEPLRECLPGLDFVRAIGRTFEAGSSRDGTCGDPQRGTFDQVVEPDRLGDYRIRCEVGRGSMGVVYEAEQVSLGRRVALKVLPFASAIDPRQRQRFLIESQAAAQLQHPHIVPVFAAGCDRGVHFYAMQFVEGWTLTEVIDAMRRRDGRAGPTDAAPWPWGSERPDPRTIARLGIEAAEALEHAHALGVVHRDVKPGNLMVDSAGALWVTDFGLARFRGDVSLTRSGDIVGTLRYMSPEQAMARRGVVDQRTDVYALGLTLYELLTLRPAFDGRAHDELLNQIAMDEPTPPRKLDPSIPRDLETIVMKAACKEASGRYATAQELADDLARFRDDRPILARRPNILERGVRWARRHSQGVGAAAVVLLLASTCGLAAVSVQSRKTEDARQALRAYIERSFALADAITMRAMEQATFSGNRAEAGNRSQMLDTYQKALSLYEEAAGLPPIDVESRKIVARARFRMGFTHAVMSRAYATARGADPTHLAEAEKVYRDAVGRFERLTAEAPEDLDVRRRFADALGEWGLGWFLAMIGRRDEAAPQYRRAFDLTREAMLDPRLDGTGLAEETASLVPLAETLAGFLEARGRKEEAEGVRGEFAAVVKELAGRPMNPERRRDLAGVLHANGGRLTAQGRRADGAMVLHAALGFDPENADSRNNLAWLLASAPDASPQDVAQALDSARKAVALDPKNWAFWNTLGVAAYRAGDWRTASEALEKSMELNKGGGPADWSFLAMTRWKQGRPDDAKQWLDRVQKDTSTDPEVRRFRTEAEALLNIADESPARDGASIR